MTSSSSFTISLFKVSKYESVLSNYRNNQEDVNLTFSSSFTISLFKVSFVFLRMIFLVGPVLFPPGPPPNNEDSSGVIVGASGYGFVPPNQGKSSP